MARSSPSSPMIGQIQRVHRPPRIRQLALDSCSVLPHAKSVPLEPPPDLGSAQVDTQPITFNVRHGLEPHPLGTVQPAFSFTPSASSGPVISAHALSYARNGAGATQITTGRLGWSGVRSECLRRLKVTYTHHFMAQPKGLALPTKTDRCKHAKRTPPEAWPQALHRLWTAGRLCGGITHPPALVLCQHSELGLFMRFKAVIPGFQRRAILKSILSKH